MYSSGQFLRLRFSIAAQLDHHIILLDEVLAVGDIAFQARCFDRIDRLRRSGKTIVLISHDLAAIERICDRAILLNQGELVMTGSPRHVIEEYSRTAYAAMSWSVSSSVAKLTRVCFSGLGEVRFGPASQCRLRLPFSQENPCRTRSSTFQFIGRAGICARS